MKTLIDFLSSIHAVYHVLTLNYTPKVIHVHFDLRTICYNFSLEGPTIFLLLAFSYNYSFLCMSTFNPLNTSLYCNSIMIELQCNDVLTLWHRTIVRDYKVIVNVNGSRPTMYRLNFSMSCHWKSQSVPILNCLLMWQIFILSSMIWIHSMYKSIRIICFPIDGLLTV